MKRYIALLLALIMCISLLPATMVQAGTDGEYEYVTTISAFNKSNMTEKLSGYKTAPVLRKGKDTLYFTDAMSWDYEIPAEYAKDGVAFKAMNLDAMQLLLVLPNRRKAVLLQLKQIQGEH